MHIHWARDATGATQVKLWMQSVSQSERLQIGVPWTISEHMGPQFADKSSIIGNKGNMNQAQ